MKKSKKILIIFIIFALVLMLIATFFIIKNRLLIKNEINEFSYVGAFIPGGQSRNLSEYDSFSEWKKDLKKDMDEHNSKAEEEKNIYLKKAEENAKEYIKNKYGFEPTFTDKKAEYSTSMVGGTDDGFVGWNYNYSGNVLLKFQKDGNDYYVLISGKDGNTLGYDNYQYDIITKAVCNMFDKELGVNILGYEIKLGKSYKLSDKETIYNLIDSYFDGNELKEILKNSKIFLEYDDKIDLRDAKWEELNNKYISNTTEVFVIRYKSDEEYSIAKKNYDSNSKYSYYSNHKHQFVYDKEFYGYDLIEKTLNIDSYLTIINNILNISKPQIGECEGIYIVQWNVDNAPSIIKSETVDVSKARKSLGILC